MFPFTPGPHLPRGHHLTNFLRALPEMGDTYSQCTCFSFVSISPSHKLLPTLYSVLYQVFST